MSALTKRLSDYLAVLGSVDPDANTADTYTTGWIDMADWHLVGALIQTGTLGSSATIDAKFQQATSDAGAGAKDVTGKAITQLTQAGSDGDKQVVLAVNGNDLDVANQFRYVRLSLTVAAATSDCSAVVLGLFPRHGVASDQDAATVDEIVDFAD